MTYCCAGQFRAITHKAHNCHGQHCKLVLQRLTEECLNLVIHLSIGCCCDSIINKHLLILIRKRKQRIKNSWGSGTTSSLDDKSEENGVKFILEEIILLLARCRPSTDWQQTYRSRQQERHKRPSIALDISNSCCRKACHLHALEKPKLLVENLMNRSANKDRPDSLTMRSQPITGDYVSAKMFLDNINPSTVRTQEGLTSGSSSAFHHDYSKELRRWEGHHTRLRMVRQRRRSRSNKQKAGTDESGARKT